MQTHVLVVEDNALLREALTRMLHNAGFAVTQAVRGEEALSLLQQTGEYRAPFDVIVSDLVMGEVDGVEVTQVARSQPEPPEVILLTSHGDLNTATAAIRLGAFDYMLRPVRQQQIVERVTSAAARRAERVRQAKEAAAWRSVAQVVSSVQPNVAAASAEAKPQRYLMIGLLRIDTKRREVWFDSEQIAVTPIEYTILVALAETPAIVITYGDLLRRTHALTTSEREAYSLLRTHVRNLRHKIDPGYLISVRGVGYMLDMPDHASPAKDSPVLVSELQARSYAVGAGLVEI